MSPFDINSKPDSWWWDLSVIGDFSVRITRRYIDNLMKLDLRKVTRWSFSVPKTVNVFIWRASHDRLPTRLNSVDWYSITCQMCNVAVQSVEHVFFEV